MNGKYSWNDGWSFLKTSVGTSYAEAAARKEEFTAVNIPHDWLIYDVLNLYQDSIGWYRKRFFWQEKEEKKAFIIIGNNFFCGYGFRFSHNRFCRRIRKR